MRLALQVAAARRPHEEDFLLFHSPREPAAYATDETCPRPSVLVVDDDVFVGRAMQHVLAAAGYDVTVTTDGTLAIDAAARHGFDTVISDIQMPGLSGLALLEAIRSRDLDVPVILLTGAPTLETAIEAVSLGAMRYLTKPVNNADLVNVVHRACTLHNIAKVRRDAAKLLGANSVEAGGRAGLQSALDRALRTLRMAFQPLVDGQASAVFGYESLMRSSEPSLPDPGAVLAAAEQLGRLTDLGQKVRLLSAAAFEQAPPETLLFVNLHTFDLLDDDLYDAAAPLSRIARRVVLEITERAALDQVPNVVSCIRRLRALGFRIAIDDLGAGYAGLSSFVALEPEFVKLDMSLVRDVHTSAIRQRLIGSLASLCNDLGMRVVAEGIETAEERDAVVGLGCKLLQGYFFAKPGPPFPAVARERLWRMELSTRVVA